MLRDVQLADLQSTARLRTLFEDAVGRGFVKRCEANHLRFIAAAQRALSLGTSNPPGSFAAVVRRDLWHVIIQRNEDAARARIEADRIRLRLWPIHGTHHRPEACLPAIPRVAIERAGSVAATIIRALCHHAASRPLSLGESFKDEAPGDAGDHSLCPSSGRHAHEPTRRAYRTELDTPAARITHVPLVRSGGTSGTRTVTCRTASTNRNREPLSPR